MHKRVEPLAPGSEPVVAAGPAVHSSPNHHPGDGPPPAGAPWDSPLGDAPLAFLDLEMTGLRPDEDRVLEVCIERVRGETVEARVATLIDPGERRGNEKIHGIGAEALVGAPSFAAVGASILAALDGAIVGAHAAAWDLAFLRAELARVGDGARAPTHAIDTLVLCRRAFHLHSYALQNVAKSFAVPVARAHRADDDVATLRAVWAKLVPALAPKTPRDLWDVRVHERAPRPEIVAALEAAVRTGTPIVVVYRPTGRPPEPITLVPTALVPPHVIGYLLPGRGRRELRLDRILRLEPDPTQTPPT
ncbi:MAG: hypothetical protein NVSMB47_08020 [Polyangiales bacterium]